MARGPEAREMSAVNDRREVAGRPKVAGSRHIGMIRIVDQRPVIDDVA